MSQKRFLVKETGVELGMGFNTLTGQPSRNIVVKSDSPPKTFPKSNMNFHANKVTSSSELAEELEVSVEASASGAWGAADSRTEYVTESKSTKNAVYLVVRNIVEASSESLLNPFFEQAPIDDRNTLSHDVWVKRYGDGWVYTIVTGGEFLAIFKFFSTSQNQKENVTQAITTAGNLLGSNVTVDASYKSSIEKVSKEATMEITVMVNGVEVHEVHLNNLMASAQQFTKDVLKKPVQLYALADNYDVVRGLTDLPFIPIVNYDWANELSQYKLELTRVEERIGFAAQKPFRFTDPSSGDLEKVKAHIEILKTYSQELGLAPATPVSTDRRNTCRKTVEGFVSTQPKFKPAYRVQVTTPGQFLSAMTDGENAGINVTNLALDEKQLWLWDHSDSKKFTPLKCWTNGNSLVGNDDNSTSLSSMPSKTDATKWNLDGQLIKADPEWGALDVNHGYQDGAVLYWQINSGGNQRWTVEEVDQAEMHSIMKG